ncbi:hypothetical protein GBAR_LOCUS3828 [Geodia barretti]|uniref:Uncharacterized protein n=1 Tax=Geodia barretti TaxID=519541 RepID=A0AA35R4N2_GEOBA|nr:hypothetical protein GBAR_LOCUS3828 [Geodia barretti]
MGPHTATSYHPLAGVKWSRYQSSSLLSRLCSSPQSQSTQSTLQLQNSWRELLVHTVRWPVTVCLPVSELMLDCLRMRKKQMLLQPHRFPSLLHLNSPPFSLFQFHLMTTSISGEALQPQDLSAPTMVWTFSYTTSSNVIVGSLLTSL